MGTTIDNNIQLESTFESSLMAGKVTAVNEGGELLINGHIKANRAVSCLLTPQLQDLVLYWLDSEHTAWVISILSAPVTEHRELALPENQALVVNTETLTINASDSIRLNALKEINLNVALGKLNECARSACQMIHGSLVQLTKHLISKSDYIDFHAEKLLKSHATQQLITAEKDIKVDADRINMG